MATLEKILKAKGIDISKLTPVPSPETPAEPSLTQDGKDILEKLEEEEQIIKRQMIEEDLINTLAYQNKIIRSQPRGRVRIVPAIPKPDPARSLFERRRNVEAPGFKVKTLNWQVFVLLFSKPEGITRREIFDELQKQKAKCTPRSVATAISTFLRKMDSKILWKTRIVDPDTKAHANLYHTACPNGKTILDLYKEFLITKSHKSGSTLNVGGARVSGIGRKKIDTTETGKEKIILYQKKGQKFLGVTNQEKEALGANIGQEMVNALIHLPENITVKFDGSVNVNINITFTLGK